MAKEMTSLTQDECWNKLRQQEFGRLAFHHNDEVHLVPINYAVDDRTRRIVFRTGEGSKLSAILRNGDVAFEVDDIGPDRAVSVVLRGRARELPHDEAVWCDQLRLRPWIASEKQHVIALEPTEVSGLSFRLHRPWRSILPEVVG